MSAGNEVKMFPGAPHNYLFFFFQDILQQALNAECTFPDLIPRQYPTEFLKASSNYQASLESARRIRDMPQSG